MAISQTYVNTLLNVALGYSDAASLPDYLYLGVCSEIPNAATGEVTGEPTADSYKRKVVGGKNAPAKCFGSATGGIIANNQEIQMATARESWGTMNYWFVSQSSIGNAILWGELKDAETGIQGVTFREKTVPVFYEGELKASIDVAL